MTLTELTLIACLKTGINSLPNSHQWEQQHWKLKSSSCLTLILTTGRGFIHIHLSPKIGFNIWDIDLQYIDVTFLIWSFAGLKPEKEITMITQARSIHQDKIFIKYYVTNFNFKQKLFLVMLLVVKLRASPFVLIDPSTGRAVEQVD